MAATAHYAWIKPTVGADADTWGTELNGSLDGIDTTMFGKLDLAGGTLAGLLTLAASTTARASLNLANGTAPTSPVNGDMWAAAGLLKYRSAGATVTLAVLEGAQVFTGAVTAAGFVGPLTGAVTGNASTATALATGRTLAITGDLTWTSPSFDGSGNVTAAGTLANSGVTAGVYGDATHVPTITFDAKGRATAASANAIPTVSAGAAGLAPASGGGAINYLRADGTWTDPRPVRGYCTVSGGVVTNVTSDGLSVARASQGLYDVTFTSPMASSGYIAVISPVAGGAGAAIEDTGTPRTVNGFRIRCQVSGGLFDPSGFNVVVWAG